MSEELRLFSENVKRFISEEAQPHYEQFEKDEIVPRELWNQPGSQGLLVVDIPEAYCERRRIRGINRTLLREVS